MSNIDTIRVQPSQLSESLTEMIELSDETLETITGGDGGDTNVKGIINIVVVRKESSNQNDDNIGGFLLSN